MVARRILFIGKAVRVLKHTSNSSERAGTPEFCPLPATLRTDSIEQIVKTIKCSLSTLLTDMSAFLPFEPLFPAQHHQYEEHILGAYHMKADVHTQNALQHLWTQVTRTSQSWRRGSGRRRCAGCEAMPPLRGSTSSVSLRRCMPRYCDRSICLEHLHLVGSHKFRVSLMLCNPKAM